MSEALFTILAERLEKLADAIAANSMPANERLWSKESIATYLGCSPSQVGQRYACLPDFPRPICLPSSGPRTAHPRWKPEEVKEWVEKYQVKAKATRCVA